MSASSSEVFLVGPGALGGALALALRRAGVPLTGVHGRSAERASRLARVLGVPVSTGALPAVAREAATAGGVILAVREADLPAAVAALRALGPPAADAVALHVSGAWPARALLGTLAADGWAVGTLHPLWSAPLQAGEPVAALPPGVAFAVEGDAAACVRARRLVGALGGAFLELSAAALPLYHAGAVLASNAVVALVDAARVLFVAAGLGEREAIAALAPLCASVAANLAAVGLPAALTGPVARADAATVQRHLEAIASARPELAPLYRQVTARMVPIARARDPRLPEAEFATILRLCHTP